MIAGIDPGLTGAVVILDPKTNTIDIIDMPTVEVIRNGKKKQELAPALLAAQLAGRNVKKAFLERVGAMPGQGVSSVFSFGRSVGIVEGVLAAYDMPVTIVPPVTWQKAVGLRGGKDGARERAMQLFPAAAEQFKRKRDDGRADAALIAWYGANL